MRDDLRDAIHNDAQMHIIHIQTTFVPLHAMMVKVVRDVLLSINHYQKITFHTFKSFSPNSLPGWVGRWNNTATQSSCAFASSVGFLEHFSRQLMKRIRIHPSALHARGTCEALLPLGEQKLWWKLRSWEVSSAFFQGFRFDNCLDGSGRSVLIGCSQRFKLQTCQVQWIWGGKWCQSVIARSGWPTWVKHWAHWAGLTWFGSSQIAATIITNMNIRIWLGNEIPFRLPFFPNI